MNACASFFRLAIAATAFVACATHASSDEVQRSASSAAAPPAPSKGTPDADKITITLDDESDVESQRTKTRMQRYLATYDITDYLNKKAFKILDGGSFSGAGEDDPIEISRDFGIEPPVMSGDPDELFLTMLHEESHWSKPTFGKAMDTALDHFKETYPTLAKDAGMEDRPEVAYIHVPVCFYELQAGKRFLGAEKTYAILCKTPVYRAIYDVVLHDEDAIGEYLVDHELNLEPFEKVGSPHACP